jgi:hypothetical protein
MLYVAVTRAPAVDRLPRSLLSRRPFGSAASISITTLRQNLSTLSTLGSGRRTSDPRRSSDR